jgi:hypothetical protein
MIQEKQNQRHTKYKNLKNEITNHKSPNLKSKLLRLKTFCQNSKIKSNQILQTPNYSKSKLRIPIFHKTPNRNEITHRDINEITTPNDRLKNE